MPKFEFTVDGTPTSHQTNNLQKRREWKETVRKAALNYWPLGQFPFEGPLQIMVVYFHKENENRIDLDNMLKPIQDALNKLVYWDDQQITDVRIRKTSIRGNFRLANLSYMLAHGFLRKTEFVYIKIEEAPDHAELL